MTTLKVGDIFNTDGIEWKIVGIHGDMAFGVNALGQVIHIKVGV